MKFILIFLLFGAVIADLSLEWDKFKRDYNKQYETVEEEIKRKQIFMENVNEIHSFQQTNLNPTFTVAINHLSDRRIEELVPARQNLKDLPESLDWRTKGVITELYQGEVGEIVTAIVSTQLVESLHAIETRQLIDGSISQVYDCCRQPIDAFNCIKNMSGICRKTDYPKALGRCEPNICKPFATFDKINRLTEPDENKMLEWIQESTLWAEMNAAGKGFNSYKGGIYDEPSCSKDPIDEVVQIVGYGSEEGKPYWLCRNNWGEQWGEKGYFRIARGKNMCKIAEKVIYMGNVYEHLTMFTAFRAIPHHTKSKYINLLRTITSTKQINVHIEMKKTNDRKEFIQAFKACTHSGYFERGQIIHTNLSDNLLNSSYIQYGRINDAQRVFDSSINKTSIHYGSMIKGSIKNNISEKAIELFSKITNPGEIHLCLLFNSCAHLRTKQALDFDLYGKMKDEGIRVNSILFVLLIDTCAQLEIESRCRLILIRMVGMDMGHDTIELYHRMPSKMIVDKTYTCILNACSHSGLADEARAIFSTIRMKND
ncbi:hypothetical protein I4U23_027712 [Adineta vaga]|nr:hypothetical protein I4U23_027712 [Adineta vaga]